MKILVPQHSSLPFVSWKEDYCAVAVDSKDLQSVFSVEWHTCQVQSHRRLEKETLSFLQQHEARGKNSLPLSLVPLSAIWCEDPSQRHLGAY